jgi:GNAT superfamily N-acetyltransferase
MNHGKLSFLPLTPDRWDDLVALFGERGACGGCWCMYWRLLSREFESRKGSGNRRAMRELLRQGVIPGILAYEGSRPIGWCSVGPREAFPRLEKARTLKRIDDRPVWSIVCLFVAQGFRNRGLSKALIKAAVDHARTHGATIVEAYPYDYRHKSEPSPPPFVYTGLIEAYLRAGFKEVARPSKTRVIVRRSIR